MAHFYLVDELESTAVGSDVVVTGSEARHAVTVSRVRVGESLKAGNGRGLVVSGTVTEATADRLVLVAETVTVHPAPSPRLVLVQALAKGDRDELAVQAATELGVDEVVPWSAARSVSRWEGPKVAKNLARWQAIVREATKQSIRAHQPAVTGLATTADLVKRASTALVLVLEPRAERALSHVDLSGTPVSGVGGADADGGVAAAEAGDAPTGDVPTGDAPTRDVLIVVGPEGGIADHELEHLEASGALLVRLGDSVLRTSTAGPAAIAVLSTRLGRW